jgi:BirA family biotin operon repressor/biotin-[acetyl-CoA-carboxylase] ligase
LDEFSAEKTWVAFSFAQHQAVSGTNDAPRTSPVVHAGASSPASSPLLKQDHLFVYDEIDSTNTECKRRIEKAGALRTNDGSLTKDGELLHKTVVAAASQTAGRGRLGRAFYSPSQTGIYFSIIFAPKGGVTDPASFTVTAAVAVCRAIDTLYKKHAQIKWVNDVYLDGKKVCGILTEGVARTVTKEDMAFANDALLAQRGKASAVAADVQRVEAAIIGIGINIAVNKDMPGELLAKAGGILGAEDGSFTPGNSCAIGKSPAEHGTVTVTRAELLAQVVFELLTSLEAGEDVVPEYRARSLLIGKKLTVTPLIGDDTTSYEAQALDITKDAGLLVQLPDGTKKTLHSGEVTLHYQP